MDIEPGEVRTAMRRDPAGVQQNILAVARAVFAESGLSGSRIEEIAARTETSKRMIYYYFGDKEGLYRAVLLEPITRITSRLQGFDDPKLPFEASMRMVLAPFIGISKDAEHDRAVVRLQLREMLEPSAVFREVVEQGVVPHHDALASLLARHVGIVRPDEGIHQLAFALVAMAYDYCMSREYMHMLAPGVLQRPHANEQIPDRLVAYSTALLRDEIERRAPRRRSVSQGVRRQQAGTAPRAVAARRR
jgi:AcrR family transcriptional regulator